MAININKFGQNAPINKTAEQQKVQQNNSQTAGAKAAESQKAPTDSVSLTPQAKQMTELQKKASDASEVNQKRVEQLKKAISSGEYKINPEKLAASIQNFEFALDR